MKLVFATDLIFDKDPITSSFDNEEFDHNTIHNYLEVYDEMLICSPISLLPFHKEPVPLTRTKEGRVSIQTLPPLSGPLSMLHFRFEAMRILLEALREGDLLIARLPSETGLLAIQAAKLLKKPYAVEVVGTAEEYSYTSFGKLFSPIMKRRLQKAISQAPAALYVTSRFLQRRYPCLGPMIACSNVQISSVSPDIATNRMNRIATCFDREAYYIGIHGALLGHNKGLDTTLKALKKVRQLTLKKVNLDIVGSGDPSRWKRMVEEMDMGSFVHFQGSITSGASMNQWLDSLDLYIQPSRHESSPKVLLEAMSRGLPVFGTRVGGIMEVLAPEQLMQPEDDDRLAMLICDLINDTTKQRRMSAHSLEMVSAYTEDRLRLKRLEFFDYINSYVPGNESKREFVESRPLDY